MSNSAKHVAPRLFIPSLGVLLAGGAFLPATAARANVIDLTATDNGWVQRSAATTVENASETLVTKRLNDTNTRIAYLRFDVSNFLASNNATDITGATLKLALVSGSGLGDAVAVYGLNDGAANTPGGEATETDWTGNTTLNPTSVGIDFNNQPAGTVAKSSTALPTANTTAALGTLAVNMTFTGSPSSAENDIVLDPTAFASFLAGDTNGQITLLFVNSTANTDNWASTTNSGGFLQPTLELTTAVPEPATIAVVGLVTALGTLRSRRRA